MFAKYAIRQDNKTRIFSGRGTIRLSCAIFARGPGYATTIVTDLPETISADFAASGFAIDHDHKRAVLCDDTVSWGVEEARAMGRLPGLLNQVEAVLSLDLTEEERCLAEPFSNELTFDGFVAALQALPLRDSWRDWQIEWIPTSALSAAVGKIYNARG